MDLHLVNKLALTTGSTKGIGKAITTKMARERTDVITSERNEAKVTKVVKEIQTVFPDTHSQVGATDISIGNQRATLLEKFSRVGILVSNMGIFEPMEYWNINDATWEKFFAVDILSGNTLVKAYLPKMPTQDFGRIILIASEKAVMPSGEMPQYNMIKAIDFFLAKSSSNLTVDTYVTANTVMPDSTLTEGVEKLLEDIYADSDIPEEDWEKDFMRSHRSRSQIQRLIWPEEISRFVTFVASLDPSSFSGEVLRIGDGLVPTTF